MAAINNNKTESMECSYLKLALLLFSAIAEHFEKSIKKNNKTEQMKHPKLRAELRPNE